MEKISRHEMPLRDALKRRYEFEEVALGYDEKTAIEEAKRCLNCKNPLCMEGCPVSVNIPEFINEIKNGDFDKAAESLLKKNNLPAICGRVCPQETQCEEKCIRNKIDGAVAIGNLERFIGDYNLKHRKVIKPDKTRELKTCVIGSGPSSLSFAAEILKAGGKVTMYEALHETGGVLVYGIPEFRLPKELVKNEIQGLIDLGLEVKTNVVVGKTILLDELKKEYDYIFIGTGAGLPSFMKIPGENLVGVFSANEYLTRVNLMKAYKEDAPTPVMKGKKVGVFGAGNVAMDAARTALRLGAEEVYIIYRRSRKEVPARHEEVIHAEQEGIKFEFLTNPIEILGKDNKVCGIKCIRMELGEPDASGRRRPIPIPNSEFEIPMDMVIVAIGTSPNPLLRSTCEGLNVSKWGTIEVNEKMETSIENVYAGGDAVTGAATVILAMGAGKKAAESVLEKYNK